MVCTGAAGGSVLENYIIRGDNREQVRGRKDKGRAGWGAVGGGWNGVGEGRVWCSLLKVCWRCAGGAAVVGGGGLSWTDAYPSL